jgi:hypothetical protein
MIDLIELFVLGLGTVAVVYPLYHIWKELLKLRLYLERRDRWINTQGPSSGG